MWESFVNRYHDMTKFGQHGKVRHRRCWLIMQTLWVGLIFACNTDDKEPAQMPSFPFEESSIEEKVLRPTGSLLQVPSNELASFWGLLTEEFETNAALITELMNEIFPDEICNSN